MNTLENKSRYSRANPDDYDSYIRELNKSNYYLTTHDWYYSNPDLKADEAIRHGWEYKIVKNPEDKNEFWIKEPTEDIESIQAFNQHCFSKLLQKNIL